eukprot:2906069-Karenia_brevis.AAC.1
MAVILQPCDLLSAQPRAVRLVGCPNEGSRVCIPTERLDDITAGGRRRPSQRGCDGGGLEGERSCQETQKVRECADRKQPAAMTA